MGYLEPEHLMLHASEFFVLEELLEGYQLESELSALLAGVGLLHKGLYRGRRATHLNQTSTQTLEFLFLVADYPLQFEFGFHLVDIYPGVTEDLFP